MCGHATLLLTVYVGRALRDHTRLPLEMCHFNLHDGLIPIVVNRHTYFQNMANPWTQFQPWQNQPLPPGWEARYDANYGR